LSQIHPIAIPLTPVFPTWEDITIHLSEDEFACFDMIRTKSSTSGSQIFDGSARLQFTDGSWIQGRALVCECYSNPKYYSITVRKNTSDNLILTPRKPRNCICDNNADDDAVRSRYWYKTVSGSNSQVEPGASLY